MSDSEQNSAISNLLGGIGEFLEVIVSFLGGIVVYSVLILLGLWIFGDSDGVETDSEVIAAFHANANASCHGAKAYEGFYDSPYLNLKEASGEWTIEEIADEDTEASGEWTIEEMPQPCLDSALLTACITGIKEHCPPDLDPPWYAKYTAPIFDKVDDKLTGFFKGETAAEVGEEELDQGGVIDLDLSADATGQPAAQGQAAQPGTAAVSGLTPAQQRRKAELLAKQQARKTGQPAAQGQPTEQSYPEGTVIQLEDGRLQVLRNGQWVDQ